MLDDYESHAAVSGHVFKELFDGFQATGGSAYACNEKRLFVWGICLVSGFGWSIRVFSFNRFTAFVFSRNIPSQTTNWGTENE